MTDFFMVNEVGELIPCPREYAEYVRFKDYDEARRDLLEKVGEIVFMESFELKHKVKELTGFKKLKKELKS